jgi:hypothetical protein
MGAGALAVSTIDLKEYPSLAAAPGAAVDQFPSCDVMSCHLVVEV